MIFGLEWEDKKVMKEWVGRIWSRDILESSSPRERKYTSPRSTELTLKLSFGRSSFLGENLERELEGETKEEKVNERERAKKKKCVGVYSLSDRFVE